MSSDSSKNKLNPLLAAISESQDLSQQDESVSAPTRKLPKIPVQLSQFYEENFLQEPSIKQPKEEILTTSDLSLPTFEVKIDPNSSTAKFEMDSILKEQLENVDFYIEQGFLDVAFSTLERLEMMFPNHPLISERLERMANLEMKNTSQGIQIPILDKTLSNQISPTPIKPEDSLNESMFRVPNTGELTNLQELVAEPETEMDFKTLVTDNATSDNVPSVTNAQSFLNKTNQENYLGEMPEEFYQTIDDDVEIESILNRVDTAAAEIAAIQNGLGSLIDDPDLVDNLEEEYVSHFNVGQAYFDIGLYDDAVEEFQNAYKAIQNSGTTSQMFQCCMLLGKSFRFKEMPRPALIWLNKALNTKQYQESEKIDLFYQLAGVHEDLGETPKALEFYKEVLKINPDYEDVKERISTLT